MQYETDVNLSGKCYKNILEKYTMFADEKFVSSEKNYSCAVMILHRNMYDYILPQDKWQGNERI